MSKSGPISFMSFQKRKFPPDKPESLVGRGRVRRRGLRHIVGIVGGGRANNRADLSDREAIALGAKVARTHMIMIRAPFPPACP
jgi:hypothetical protein